MFEPVRFVIHGKAVPQGSKVSYALMKNGKPVLGPGGRPVVVTAPDNPDLKDWRAIIATAAERAFWEDEPVKEAVALWVLFERKRPDSHYGTGRNAGVLKPRFANAMPITRPDTLKLTRAVEDAMSNVIYDDDSNIVDHYLKKRWGKSHKLTIWIYPQEVSNGKEDNQGGNPREAEAGQCVSNQEEFWGENDGAVPGDGIADRGSSRGPCVRYYPALLEEWLEA